MDGEYSLRLSWLRLLRVGFGKLLASIVAAATAAATFAAAAKSAASVGSAALAAT